jgi:hypothetical protein
MTTNRGDHAIETPFVILVDSNEGHPFQFKGINADADKEYRPVKVRTAVANLGRFPNSFGDYTIDGLRGLVAVERKSMEDIQSTILGWEDDYQKENNLHGRRARFESELDNFNAYMKFSAVIVEATLGNCLREMPEYGVKTAEQNKKTFWRSYLSYTQRFPRVQWIFCDTRRMAEIMCFDYLSRVWRKNRE